MFYSHKSNPLTKTQILPMCFSLFRSSSSSKSKKSDITSKRSSHKLTTSPVFSSSDRSQINSRSNEFNSKSSSISSRASLSSLKDSLPENPHIYDLSEIRSATKNFLLKPTSSSSSTSWKCLIDKKQSMVTQRKLRRPIDNSELRKKLSVLCKSHHASLVKLHGACVSGNYIYLVYEFVNGANLSDCLRNPRNPNFTVLSNWVSRVQIVAGIADGLDYMHNCAGFKNGFIHNHIKSSSIIVCDEPAFVPKICHFGTALLCGEVPEAVIEEEEVEIEEEKGLGLDSPVLKRVGSAVGKFVGTRGYMSPEFQMTGVPTLKSDVFAFGVVILELLSGEEPMKVRADSGMGVFRKVSLIDTAKEAVGGGTGKLRQWIDRRLRDSYPVEVAERLARVALECIQEDPVKRPDMGRVANWISKVYLESKTWAQSIGLPDEITVSLAPR